MTCSREDVHPVVNRYRGALFKGFMTLEDAQAYMKDNDVTEYNYQVKHDAEDTIPR